jgi:hypothetical protein
VRPAPAAAIAAWGFRQYQQLIDDYEEKWKAIREKGK